MVVNFIKKVTQYLIVDKFLRKGGVGKRSTSCLKQLTLTVDVFYFKYVQLSLFRIPRHQPGCKKFVDRAFLG